MSSIIILAGPAGAASDCEESMNPAASGNSSGLIVACTFSSLGTSSTLSIIDYDNAVWHYGAARNVNVTVQRTASSTAGKLTIKSRPTNNIAAASCANNPAGQTGVPAGNLAITARDINHSIEFAASTAAKTGMFIAPGTFIKAVAAPVGAGCAQTTVVTLSKATLAGGPLCPGTTPAQKNGNCTNSVGAQVLISNDTGRTLTNGVTASGSSTVTSPTAHFCAPTFFTGASSNVTANTITKTGHVLANNDRIRLTGLSTTTGVANNATYFVVQVVAGSSFKVALTAGGAARDLTGTNQTATINVGPATPECGLAATQQTDVGKRFSGGDLPDGATIATVNSVRNVTLACVGCVGGFTGVTSASNQVISLSDFDPPTSARYVTNGSTNNTKVISSATAEFANTDIGLPVVFNPPIPTAAGARIAAVAADGSTATLASPVNIPTASNRKFTVGVPTKTAPATNDVAGTLAILLKVNPTVSPTSPPCGADKVSGFQIPLLWKNPGAYNTVVNGGLNQFSGTSPAATSIAQFDFNTSSTSFSGYLEQNYTTTASVAGPSSYTVRYTFLPITVGLCPGTGDATTFNFNGLALKNAQVPSFTGGGGGGLRGIEPEPQGTSTVYTGSTGARVVSGAAEQPSNSNSCTVSSPSTLTVGC